MLYVAAATVIPVLFLAIAVQGDAYRGLIDRAIARDTASVYARRLDRKMVNYITGTVLLSAALLIVVVGIGGELVALWALVIRDPSMTFEATTYVSASCPTFAAGVGPLAGFLRYMANYPPKRPLSRGSRR